ncbi:PsiF family protein [Paraburkholderia humisilvae]|uniref:Phosphate starvation-inducible protein PsiF n=1 Tax=Paraburkholderia humisilvae TaxID=627669 RepID=A0A6J5DCM3_9BURK|nr:PsiF family protein [Paraburkholderia humisilvae]CAB3750735.1 Phosphate starvation-inducible protein PsiF [Paraburkholderia humisilvae]
MKIQSAIAALVLGGLLAAPAFADNSQQNKMTMCNKQAGDKKGDDRKAFMKSCLSASSAMAASAPMTQQEKMKACNAQAGDKKGDDRKAFMKTCLSNKG